MQQQIHLGGHKTPGSVVESVDQTHTLSAKPRVITESHKQTINHRGPMQFTLPRLNRKGTCPTMSVYSGEGN